MITNFSDENSASIFRAEVVFDIHSNLINIYVKYGLKEKYVFLQMPCFCRYIMSEKCDLKGKCTHGYGFIQVVPKICIYCGNFVGHLSVSCSPLSTLPRSWRWSFWKPTVDFANSPSVSADVCDDIVYSNVFILFFH